MRITESQLRSIIKNELNNILSEGNITLNPNGPAPYGIPNWAIKKALELEQQIKNQDDAPTVDGNHFPEAIAEVTQLPIEKFNFIGQQQYRKLKEYYYNQTDQYKKQAKSPQSAQTRTDRFMKKLDPELAERKR